MFEITGYFGENELGNFVVFLGIQIEINFMYVPFNFQLSPIHLDLKVTSKALQKCIKSIKYKCIKTNIILCSFELYFFRDVKFENVLTK